MTNVLKCIYSQNNTSSLLFPKEYNPSNHALSFTGIFKMKIACHRLLDSCVYVDGLKIAILLLRATRHE